MDDRKIQIKCKGAIELDLFELEEFQGELKSLSTIRYNQLKKSILELGFSFPESVWQRPEGRWTILDGTQRVRTLKRMVQKEGYECPKIPCSIVEAKDKKEAKLKLLAAASQYGQVESQGLYEFITDAEISFDQLKENFNFPEVDITKFHKEFFEEIDDASEESSEKQIECPSCGHSFVP